MMNVMQAAFYANIEHDTVNGCWLWTGQLDRGYGLAAFAGKKISAHRVSHLLFIGDIPKDLGVLHRCHQPCCVNPSHLYAGTNRQNVDDKLRRIGCDPALRVKRETRDFLKGFPLKRTYNKSGNPRRKPAPDSRHGTNRVLTVDQVREIRGSTERGCDLADRYGVARGTISKIRNGQLWSTLP